MVTRLACKLFQLAFLFRSALSQGYEYTGYQCNGVFDSILLNTTSSYHIIDETVKKYMTDMYNEVPWLYLSCVSRLRQQFCMLTLSGLNQVQMGSSDGKYYCYKVVM